MLRGLSLVLGMEDEVLHIETLMGIEEMKTGVKDLKGSWERLVRWEFWWVVKHYPTFHLRMATYSLMSRGPRVERRGSAFHTK